MLSRKRYRRPTFSLVLYAGLLGSIQMILDTFLALFWPLSDILNWKTTVFKTFTLQSYYIKRYRVFCFLEKEIQAIKDAKIFIVFIYKFIRCNSNDKWPLQLLQPFFPFYDPPCDILNLKTIVFKLLRFEMK